VTNVDGSLVERLDLILHTWERDKLDLDPFILEEALALRQRQSELRNTASGIGDHAHPDFRRLVSHRSGNDA
jgi:hypothetical protein